MSIIHFLFFSNLSASGCSSLLLLSCPQSSPRSLCLLAFWSRFISSHFASLAPSFRQCSSPILGLLLSLLISKISFLLLPFYILQPVLLLPSIGFLLIFQSVSRNVAPVVFRFGVKYCSSSSSPSYLTASDTRLSRAALW